ncbi:hypothetical protein D3C76_1781460 [compost metagenome]
MEQRPDNNQINQQLNAADENIQIRIQLERGYQDKKHIPPCDIGGNIGNPAGNQAFAYGFNKHYHGDQGKV